MSAIPTEMTRAEAEGRHMQSRVILHQLTEMVDSGHVPVEHIELVSDEIDELQSLLAYFPERPQKVEVLIRAFSALRALIKSVAN